MNPSLLPKELHSEKYTAACKDEEGARADVSHTSTPDMESPHDALSLEEEYKDSCEVPREPTSKKNFDRSLTIMKGNSKSMLSVPGSNNTSMSGFSIPDDMKSLTTHKYFSSIDRAFEMSEDKSKGPSDINPFTDESIDLRSTCNISASETEQNKQFIMHPSPKREKMYQNILQHKNDSREELCETRFEKEASDKEEVAIDLSTRKDGDTGEKQPSFEVREKSFEEKENLSMHKRIQRKRRRVFCDVCNKGFSCKSKLERHERFHAGEKPFACGVCKKGFTRSNSLKKHARTHTGEKPFSCDECGKSFAEKGNLEAHKLTHTVEKPFTCDDCEKSFPSKRYLTRHKRIHTGQKPFTCSVCEKSFAQKGHLTRHELTHRDEKPFICEHCQKAFASKYYLKNHEKRHTVERKPVIGLPEKSFAENENVSKEAET